MRNNYQLMVFCCHSVSRQRKIVISLQRYDQSPWNLAGWCRMYTCSAQLLQFEMSKMANGNHLKNWMNGSHKCIGCLPLKKLIFLTISAPEWPILHHCAKFCWDRSHSCRDMMIFRDCLQLFKKLSSLRFWMNFYATIHTVKTPIMRDCHFCCKIMQVFAIKNYPKLR